MKSSVLLVLAMSAILCVGSGCYSPAAVKGEILAVMNQQAKDWTAGDLEGFMQGFHKSDDLRLAHGKGITRGWQRLLDAYKRGTKKSRLEFSGVDITSLSDRSAVVFGRFHNYFEDKSYRTGFFTLLMRKIDGEWKIVHDHCSDLPPDYKGN